MGRRAAPPALAGLLTAALALVLVVTVFGEVDLRIGSVAVHLGYKNLLRTLAVVGMVLLVLPATRAALPVRWAEADLALGLFAVAAALSAAFGGGRFGDVRSLFAAIALGWLARGLFAPAARRPVLLYLLGATVCLVLARELAAHPELVPPRTALRYVLVTANANTLGFLFAMVAPLFLAEVRATRGPQRAAAVLVTAAAVLGTLITLSRTAAAGLTLGSLAALGATRRRAWLALLAVAALGAYLAVQRTDVWSTEGRRGDVDRLRIMATSLTLFAEHPLLGVGFGINNLEQHFPARYQARYGTPLFRFHSMNQLVDLLVGTGLVGTALALWWAALLARLLRGRLRAAPPGPVRARAAGQLGAAAAIALMSMADAPLYHGKLLPLLFLVLAYVQLEPAD
jgi:hypothetical protein